MRTYFGRPGRRLVWIGGIAIGLLAATGIVASVSSFPGTDAVTADEIAAYGDRSTSAGPEEAQVGRERARVAVAPAAATSRGRSRCPECGVVLSMRTIESTGEDAPEAVTKTVYEVTVRLRDGTTTVFTAAVPRDWRPGSRVIVMAGAEASVR
jgi:hypothetical protein